MNICDERGLFFSSPQTDSATIGGAELVFGLAPIGRGGERAPRPPTASAWLFVAEIEHRIANEFAMAVASISLAAARSNDPEVKTAMAGAAQRLRDYAGAHRALQAPVTGGPMALSHYLSQLCAALAQARLTDRGVRLTLIEAAVELDAEQCWRVGLIVSELITNAVRHGVGGPGGAIEVEILRAAGDIQCRVSDNGRALRQPEPGCGGQLVEALANDLGGGVERRFGPHGTSVILSFPDPGASARDSAERLTSRCEHG
jgi:two-component sensor histidine kinase